jgi:hypothetical protein
MQMIAMVKRLLATPTPLELAARELVQAQRGKLEAETAMDYATSMVMYNDERIERLVRRLNEMKEQV